MVKLTNQYYTAVYIQYTGTLTVLSPGLRPCKKQALLGGKSVDFWYRLGGGLGAQVGLQSAQGQFHPAQVCDVLAAGKLAVEGHAVYAELLRLAVGMSQ